MEWSKVKEELQKPLSPDAIKPPPKGKFGEYVTGLHVIREANRIFGEDGWSYSITRLEMTNRATLKLTGKNGEYEQMRIGYLCSVRVDVGGVHREGVSAGSGVGSPDSEADHHDSAIKEAETDALKRALRTFGNTFGLALYEKDKAAREVGYSLDQVIFDSIRDCQDTAKLEGLWRGNVNYQTIPEFRSAVMSRKKELAAKDERKAELEKG